MNNIHNRKLYGIIIVAALMIALIAAIFALSRGKDDSRANVSTTPVTTGTIATAARTAPQATTTAAPQESTSAAPAAAPVADTADEGTGANDLASAQESEPLKIMSFGCSAPGCKPSPPPYPSAPKPHAGAEILYLAELSGQAASVTVKVVDLDTSAVVSVTPMVSHGLITGGPYKGNYDWQLDTAWAAPGRYRVSVEAVASNGTAVSDPGIGSMEFEVV